MWIIVYWICTVGSCTTNYVPGFYQDQKQCEEIAMAFVKGPSQSLNPDIRKDAQCVKATDMGFE